jgi:hypothetical protein
MIRKLLSSVVCLVLAPILVAQQAAAPGAITVPKDTRIEIVALDRITSESAMTGSEVRFAISKDVVVDGRTVLPAGTPVTGILTKVVKAKSPKQVGKLQVRIRAVAVGNNWKLPLTSSDPSSRETPREKFNDGAINTLEVIGGIVLLPLELPMAIAINPGGRGIGRPADAVLPRCYGESYWVRADTILDHSNATELAKKAQNLSGDGCVSGREKPIMDWSVSDVEHVLVE